MTKWLGRNLLYRAVSAMIGLSLVGVAAAIPAMPVAAYNCTYSCFAIYQWFGGAKGAATTTNLVRSNVSAPGDGTTNALGGQLWVAEPNNPDPTCRAYGRCIVTVGQKVRFGAQPYLFYAVVGPGRPYSETLFGQVNASNEGMQVRYQLLHNDANTAWNISTSLGYSTNVSLGINISRIDVGQQLDGQDSVYNPRVSFRGNEWISDANIPYYQAYPVPSVNDRPIVNSPLRGTFDVYYPSTGGGGYWLTYCEQPDGQNYC